MMLGCLGWKVFVNAVVSCKFLVADQLTTVLSTTLGSGSLFSSMLRGLRILSLGCRHNFLVFDGGLSSVNESEREELDYMETRAGRIYHRSNVELCFAAYFEEE